MNANLVRRLLAVGMLIAQPGCTTHPDTFSRPLTFAGSAVGREGQILHQQLAAFEASHPGTRVIVRPVPDAAEQQHQLYVQWLNAYAPEPDVLQLDVVTTPEFAAAEWILPLDRFHPDVGRFFPATIEANRWRGRLYALPWFVDVGMLYWRTDVLDAAPTTFAELSAQAGRAQRTLRVPFGLVWTGARYEGLVTVFLEYLHGFGGRLLDADARVTVASDAGVRALTTMRDEIYEEGVVPADALTWQEEQTRFAFQSGRAVLMRNWPYAFPLLEDPRSSRVAGRFRIALMPSGAGGTPAATLGGQQLAINAHSRQPDLAYALIEHLTAPDQMLARARVAGEYPARPDLYASRELQDALAAPTDQVRRIIEHAVPRPITPVYAELSEILQVHLHRALTRQQEPRAALTEAAAAIERLLVRSGLAGQPS